MATMTKKEQNGEEKTHNKNTTYFLLGNRNYSMFHGFKPFHMRWNKYNEINEYCCRCCACACVCVCGVDCGMRTMCVQFNVYHWNAEVDSFLMRLKFIEKQILTCVGVCCVKTTMRFACTIQSLFAANIIGTESSFGLKIESKIQKWNERTNKTGKNKQTNNKNAYFNINIWMFGAYLFSLWVRLCVDWRIKMQWTKYIRHLQNSIYQKNVINRCLVWTLLITWQKFYHIHITHAQTHSHGVEWNGQSVKHGTFTRVSALHPLFLTLCCIHLPRGTRRIDFESYLSRFSADFSILRRGKSRNSWMYTLCMGIVATYCQFRCLVQRLIYDNRQRPVSPATIHSLCSIESVAISIQANAEISYAPCNICGKKMETVRVSGCVRACECVFWVFCQFSVDWKFRFLLYSSWANKYISKYIPSDVALQCCLHGWHIYGIFIAWFSSGLKACASRTTINYITDTWTFR